MSATAGVVTLLALGRRPSTIEVGTVALVALVLAWVAVQLGRSRIVLTPHEINVDGPVLRRRRPRARIAEVWRVTEGTPHPAPAGTLFLLDEHRNLLVKVYAQHYASQDIDRLINALGAPCRSAPWPHRRGTGIGPDRAGPGSPSPLASRSSHGRRDPA
ncbi:hypothetical protein ACFQU9_40295 [Actinomadura namibiensis]|uniref:PH domain-containing protein n=1 Tax=Actinomadura namibiensis TaxID=182080 RepID=A0A7W3LLP1_ACTNM|nr:hypothetical protein [Actinomadura namibiensis]MBA8950448.1 hypothetical protein [Actinomadura namibiensis]